MFTDNTLTPKEAVRLCALGILADAPTEYGALAASVRHFVSHIIGPSLDVMGQSIELLRYEGLVEDVAGDEDDVPGRAGEVLAITDLGRQELSTLLLANVRHGATELNKLIVALKFRFMHSLGDDDRARQIDLLIDLHENEHARLENLRACHAEDAGYLAGWLDQEMAETDRRIQWLKELRQQGVSR
ncbi:MAG: hypothetical protein RIC16_02570 [Rhodospirillales bacterium]